MQMSHAGFARSPALRVSLKRGIARQAIAQANRAAPDLPGLFCRASGLRPNAKAAARLARRIGTFPGVTRVALLPGGKGLSFTARAVRQVEARAEGTTVFHETGLIYLCVRVGFIGGLCGCNLTAVSFCTHALERLVERSAVDLHAALLPRVDAEAQAILRGWDRGIDDAQDSYYPAVLPGVWAGSRDEMTLDPDWRLANASGRLPIFSARTFLSEAEMRPTVWLRWKDDPACRIA